MPAFCGNCGAPLDERSGACGTCYARANPSPVAATGGGGSVLKIVLIAVGVVFVLAVVSLGGMYYAAHHYLKVAEESTGIKAGDVARTIREAAQRGTHHESAATRDGCLLLSNAEASAILGIEVERSSGKPDANQSGEYCSFFVKPGSVAQHEKSAPRQGEQTLQDRLDEIKLRSRMAIEGDPHGPSPYFTYTVEREDGRTACSALRLANGLSGGEAIGATGDKAPLGVGDQAVMGIGESLMCVAKGDSSITLELNQIAGARAIGIALAQTILPRL